MSAAACSVFLSLVAVQLIRRTATAVVHHQAAGSACSVSYGARRTYSVRRAQVLSWASLSRLHAVMYVLTWHGSSCVPSKYTTA